MSTPTTSARRLAIAAGTAATLGALAILCSDALRTWHWELEHALMPIVVGITIASGHLIGSAMRSWRFLSAAGFTVLFVIGTAATVYNSVGRQAATADRNEATALEHNDAHETAKSDLLVAKKKLGEAEFLAQWEIAGRPRDKQGEPTLTGKPTGTTGCGTGCKGWQETAETQRKIVADLEAKIQALGPEVIAAPKADRAARVAALFGFERDRVKEILYLIEPFLYALLFELAAIVAFGFGFAHTRPAKAEKKADAPAQPKPKAKPQRTRPSPPDGGQRTPAPVIPDDHPVIKVLRREGRPLTNDELAKAQGVTKGESSKRWREVAHLLEVTRDPSNGRQLQIALARRPLRAVA